MGRRDRERRKEGRVKRGEEEEGREDNAYLIDLGQHLYFWPVQYPQR